MVLTELGAALGLIDVKGTLRAAMGTSPRGGSVETYDRREDPTGTLP